MIEVAYLSLLSRPSELGSAVDRRLPCTVIATVIATVIVTCTPAAWLLQVTKGVCSSLSEGHFQPEAQPRCLQLEATDPAVCELAKFALPGKLAVWGLTDCRGLCTFLTTRVKISPECSLHQKMSSC